MTVNRRERRRWLRAVRAAGLAPESVRVAEWMAAHADGRDAVEIADDYTDPRTGDSLLKVLEVPSWRRR